MVDFIPLDRLLPQGRADGTVLGWRAGIAMDFARFRADCALWRATFEQSSGVRFALYFNDAVAFAAALFGAWHAGKCVYLPGDALPQTLARIAPCVDGLVGDLPGAMPQLRMADSRPWAPLDVSASGLVVYTSGSTGEPVAIPKRLGQLFSEVTTLAKAFDANIGAASVLATVSHQHIYGLLFTVLWPLASGRPMAVNRLLYAEDIAAAVVGRDACVLVASPAHLKRLPATLPVASLRSKLRAVFSSGGMLPEYAATESLERLGCSPIEVYGSSETGGVAWRQRALDACWQPLPDVEIRVADHCLSVRSPYLPSTDWYQTADGAVLAGERFELLGRVDRIVKIEEKRVSLPAVEAALTATGLVAEACALLLAGARSTLGVVAVLSESGRAMHADLGRRGLAQYLRQQLASSFEACVLPRNWRFTLALPVNAQGKSTADALNALFDPRWPPFQVLEQLPAQARLRLDVLATSPYFDGHFPNAPILPGVAQLAWAVHFGRNIFPLRPAFVRLEAVKFMQVISPGAVVTLELLHKQVGDTPDIHDVLSFKISADGGVHASGRVVFGNVA